MPEQSAFDPMLSRLWSQLRDCARAITSVRVIPVKLANTYAHDADEITESHPIPTVIGGLSGVVRVELDRQEMIDLRPGEIVVLVAGVRHRHAVLRAGSASYEQGFLPRSSDLMLKAPQRTWRGVLPLEPSQSLVHAIIATRSSDKRCRLAAELLGQFEQQAAAPPTPMHPGVERMLAFLRANRRRPISSSDLVRASGLSPSHAHKLFLMHHGETPKQALLRDRLLIASELIASGAGIGEAATRSGFTGAADLSRSFRRRYGVSPRTWVRSGRSLPPA